MFNMASIKRPLSLHQQSRERAIKEGFGSHLNPALLLGIKSIIVSNFKCNPD